LEKLDDFLSDRRPRARAARPATDRSGRCGPAVAGYRPEPCHARSPLAERRCRRLVVRAAVGTGGAPTRGTAVRPGFTPRAKTSIEIGGSKKGGAVNDPFEALHLDRSDNLRACRDRPHHPAVHPFP